MLFKERSLRTGLGRWVFPADSNSGHAENPHKAWYKALKAAGLYEVKEGETRLRFHDLRHTAATRLAEVGVPITTIKDLLGHSTLATTERYCHPMQSIVDAVEVLCSGDIEVTLGHENEVHS